MATAHDVNVVLTEATIAKLDLEPDDVIVIRITDPDYKPSKEDVEYMRKRTREILGEHEVLILAQGIDLEIVRTKEEA